jgi:hypothetical protein
MVLLTLAGVVAAGPAFAAPHHKPHRKHVSHKAHVPSTKTPRVLQRTSEPHNASSTPANAHASYFGGEVIEHVKVYAVLYGTGTFLPEMASPTAPNLDNFISGLVDSPYIDLASEYSTGIETIGRGTYAGQIAITPSPANDGADIDDAANIQPELEAQITANSLPAPDADTLYVLFFPKGQVIHEGGGTSKVDFCGYHNTSATAHVRYAVIPYDASDLDPLTPGTAGCGAKVGFGNFTSVLSHEIIESITDPDVGLAFGFLPPLSWYDANNGEVSDICNQQQTKILLSDGFRYVVQKNWSNQQRKCVAIGPPRTVSVGDSAIAEGDGGTRTLQIPITLSSGSSTPLSVDYTLAGAGANAATAGVDFNDGGGSGTLAFPMVTKKSTAVTQYVSVPISPDVDLESDETIDLTVTSVTVGYGIDRDTGTGTILNDDVGSGATLAVGDMAVVVGQAKSKGMLDIPIVLNAPAASDITVSFLASTVDATSKDYSAKKGGTLKILAGQTGTTVHFLVKPHLDALVDKSVTITLSNAVGATIVRSVGTATFLRA